MIFKSFVRAEHSARTYPKFIYVVSYVDNYVVGKTDSAMVLPGLS